MARRTFRRKTTAQRRFKRKFRRGYRFKRSRSGWNKVYYFTRYADYGEVYANSLTPSFGAFNFSLADVPNSTEFTALYDQYKIMAVKMWFIPQQTQSVSIGSINNPENNSRFFTCIDYNDATLPVSVDEVRQYKSAKFTNLLRVHKRYIYKPKIVDAGSWTISPWVATSSPGTNYFGLKYAIEPMSSSTTTTMTYSVEAKLYFAFKNVK